MKSPNAQLSTFNFQLSTSDACPFDRAAVMVLCPTVTPPERIRRDAAVCGVVVHAAAGLVRQMERGERAARQHRAVARWERERDVRARERREARLHQHNCTRLQSPFAGLVFTTDKHG